MNPLAPTAAAPVGMPRRVEPEWLDSLPASDPRAIEARHDLRRLNRVLGSVDILLNALDGLVVAGQPLHLVELGAGDGVLMRQIAQRRQGTWGAVQLTLLDRHPLVDAGTLAAFRDCGWHVEVREADVFRWLAGPPVDNSSVLLANLFLHHFEGPALSRLLGGVAARARAFVCSEPRRSPWSLAASHLVGLLGSNAVTRHDAVVSVRAGFTATELSQHWPAASAARWALAESPAGPFCHRFVARRVPDETAA